MESTTRAARIDFSASGSEYFRIWIVNLLLIVITLGFYLPFAKARRLRYFYANTAVGGQPLAFHGDPWKMLRGYLLMLALFGLYAVSGQLSGWLPVIAFLALAGLWPLLWRSSLRFRLANTSWRGLRFGFEGSVADAYRAMLPLFVPGLILIATSAWALNGVAQDDEAAMAAASARMLPGMLAGLLASVLLLPLGFWLIKRYQHGGYRYANQRAQFDAGVGSFYKLGLKAIGLSLLAVAAFGLLLAVLLPAAGAALKGAGMVGATAVTLIVLVLYVGLLSLMQAYTVARLQNLSWNATRSASLRFDSQLGVRALTERTLRNLLLTVLTLGLYRPFAVVNMAALRLQALTLHFDESPSQWRADASADRVGASGEMSGDFFGFDVGL